jgi:hypothetical protein
MRGSVARGRERAALGTEWPRALLSEPGREGVATHGGGDGADDAAVRRDLRWALFPLADIDGSNPHTGYDVSPDGRTFAMVRRSPATRIMVIQNLPALVRRLRGSVEESR